MSRLISSESPRPKLDAETRKIVASMYHDARHVPGFSLEDWIEQVSENLDCPDDLIRKVVLKENKAFALSQRVVALTWAQKEADLIGASQEAALRTLTEGLRATKQKLLVDKDGYPILSQDNQKQFIDVPDWPSRIRASALILDVQGSKAPRQVQVSGEVRHTHKTTAELASELNALLKEMEQEGLVIDVKPANQIEAAEAGNE